MISIKDALQPYYINSVHLEDDGVIGIPVTLTVYTETDPNKRSPMILYVINTNTERIGTESDLDILSDYVKDYIVVVIDYHGNEAAAGIPLDHSIHRLRRLIISQKFAVGNRQFHAAADNWILPAGCRLIRHFPYFNFRENGPIGILDYIVKIWNEDFTEVRGNVEITFADGSKKLVRDIHPTKVEECLNRDGTPIDLNLHLDVIYPSKPKEGVKCPVGVFAASRQSTTGNWVMSHFPGYVTSMLFSGYGAMLFEYPYVPMSRSDHYGYFPDGPSYKRESCDRHHGLGFFTGTHSSCAAIRAFRYLCRTNPALKALDPDRLGVFCISKTGYNYCLSVPFPEQLPEKRYLEGHHGEFPENVPQPYLTYPDGEPIRANVQAVYTVSGSGDYYAREGMSPIMTTVGMTESALSFYRSITENAKQLDTECLFYTVPDLGHSMAYGYDPEYNLDMYRAVLEFMDTHLLRSHGECEYITPRNGATIANDASVTLHFTGAVAREELEKYPLITDLYGRKLPYTLEGSYGDCVWTLRPSLPDDAKCVTVSVPVGVTLKNGTKTTRICQSTYRTAAEHLSVSLCATESILDETHEIRFAPVKINRTHNERSLLCFTVKANSAQLIGVYANGKRIGTIAVGPAKTYSLDITDSVPAYTLTEFTLRAEKPIGESVHTDIRFTKDDEPYTLTLKEYVTSEMVAKDGKTVLSVTLDEYNYTKDRGYSLLVPLKDGLWEKEDFGRLFRIEARVMSPSPLLPRGTYVSVPYNRDPFSRYVDTEQEARVLLHPEHTPGEWCDVCVQYQLKNPEHMEEQIDKRSVRINHDSGTLLIDHITATEITTPVEISLGEDQNGPRIVNTGLSHG